MRDVFLECIEIYIAFALPVILGCIYYLAKWVWKKLVKLFYKARQRFAILVCWLIYPDIYKAYKKGYRI